MILNQWKGNKSWILVFERHDNGPGDTTDMVDNIVYMILNKGLHSRNTLTTGVEYHCNLFSKKSTGIT